MPTQQEQFDEAMQVYSQGDYAGCIHRLDALLAASPDYFEARLALGMAYYRAGDLAAAIAAGHQAEAQHPNEPLVHTNLSLFYVKAGDKEAAERHGLKARLAAWKKNPDAPAPADSPASLPSAAPKPAAVKLPPKFPDMPWKKKPPIARGSSSADGPGTIPPHNDPPKT